MVFALIVSIGKCMPSIRRWSVNKSRVAAKENDKMEMEKEQESIESIELDLGPNVNSMPFSLPREN